MTARPGALRRKLARLMVLASVIALLLSALALLLVAGYRSRQQSEHDLQTLASVIADNSAAALGFGDVHTARRILAAVQANADITLVCLFTADAVGRPGPVFSAWPSDRAEDCPDTLLPDHGGIAADQMRVQESVTVDGVPLGSLTMTMDLRSQRWALLQQAGLTSAVVGLALLLTFSFALRSQTAMVAPIMALAALARRVSLTADYSLRTEIKVDDETGQLAEDFNHMLAKIEASDQEARAARDALGAEVLQKSAANRELQLTLERLTAAQEQLVQAEKLASLGALVAGVAHEINTPVGVAVTAASTLRARATTLRGQYSDGSMRRSDLETFIGVAEDSTRMLLNNLQRAADLIQSFKRVAVDQSSDERRRFQLSSYIREVLLSLGPKLKNIEVAVDCPDDIWVDSFPGAIAQVLTNFVTNSTLHGFDDGRKGRIQLQARMLNEQVELRYQDNGCGMKAEHLSRIFDPFFTTKRGAGGSGLGMHIVYNLVTQRLGGRIRALSPEGQGLLLVLQLPLTAPAVAGGRHLDAKT